MKQDIVLIGGGGHAKVIIEMIQESNQYNIIGICDKGTGSVRGIPIIGDDEILPSLYQQGLRNAFICIGAIGNPQKRWQIYEHLKKIGYVLPVIIHPNTIISSSVVINEGTCIMPGAIINAEVQIGRLAIINTGSIIEHECIIGDNSHISPGACLCGRVRVGEHTHIGARTVVNQMISIGSDVLVGSGSVVVKDISHQVRVWGVPAKER